jgi:hypothetical protein
MSPVVCLSVSLFAGAPLDDAWQSVTVLRDGALTVRLKCRRAASLADTEWLALEFENAGPGPLTITGLHYRLEHQALEPKTGQRLHSGGLASGGDADLFPEAFRVTPVADRVLEPGKVRRAVAQPSDYSAALLGLPTRDGWRIQAACHFFITFPGRLTVSTPAAGVPFTFLWRPPDEAGFTALRARLKALLAAPEPTMEQYYLLGALWKVSEVSAGVTRDDLLAALAKREKVPWARGYIADALAERFPRDAAVRDYYRERLRARDPDAVRELTRKGLWHPEFIGPLVGLYEGSPPVFQALSVLHTHRDDWKADPQVTARLAAAVRRREPAVTRPVGEPWTTSGAGR